MARLTFPNAEDRLVYTIAGASDFRPKVGALVRIYTDVNATTLADIQTLAGAAITNSELTVDANSLLPRFLGPNTGTDTLYAKGVGGTTVTMIHADVDSRLDALNLALGAVSTITDPSQLVTQTQRTSDSASALATFESQVQGALGKRLAFIGDKRNRRLFHDDGDLNNWIQTPGTGTITSAQASPATRGGSVISMATGGVATAMSLISTTGPGKQPNDISPSWRPPSHRPYVITAEFSCTAAKWYSVAGINGGTNAFLYTVNFGGTLLTINHNGGTTLTLTTANIPNFDITRKHRFLALIDPVAMTATHFLYYTDTVSVTSTHLYLGTSTINILPQQGKCYPATNQTGVTLTIEHFYVYEVHGVSNGASTDCSYNAWEMNPDQFFTVPDLLGNMAQGVARRLNDGGDWYVNHAHGGYRVDQMLSEFTQWVLAFKPRVIIIGSATNSLAAANSLSGTAKSNYIAQAQTDYLSMVTQALATGAAVLCRTIAPRSDAAGGFSGVAPQASRLQFETWNAWMRTTLPPLGVAVSDVYAALGDATDPTVLATWANAGDAVHLTMRAIQTICDIDVHALMTLRASA